MTIEELKKEIESKNLTQSSYIFVYKKSRFLVDQYAREIARIENRGLIFIKEYTEEETFFDDLDDGNLYVFSTDSFNATPKKNHIIITKKSSNEMAINFPEVKTWQIKDYVYSKCSGVDGSILDKLISSYQDAYSLENEINKICIFDEKMRGSLCNDFLDDDVFSSISKSDMFSFVNAIQRKNVNDVGRLYSKLEMDPMPFIGLLYKQFRNMLDVALQRTPTEENTGLKSNQIYAIKKVCQNYTKQQILDIFKFLCSLENRLKLGELPADCLFDYVLVKVLSV